MPLFNFSGTLCVDTFLFISAFLATFLLLKKMEKGTYAPPSLPPS